MILAPRRYVRAIAALLGALGATVVPGQAQSGFERTYGGTFGDVAYAVRQTPDSGYIVTGYSRGDVYLIRTDAAGDTIWTKTYGGPASDIGVSVQPALGGGYVVAGHTLSYGAGSVDAYLIRTDEQGDTLWTRTYGGTAADYGLAVVQTPDSGYAIGGYTLSSGSGLADAYLVRTNASGDTLWTRTYGGAFNDYCRSLERTSDGGFILAGESISISSPSFQMFLVRTDSLGETLWTRRYGGTADEYGYSVQQTADTGFVVAGFTESFGAGEADIYLVKTDASGDTLWTRTYGDTLRDQGASVRQTSDGGFIVAGSTQSFGAGLYDLYLIRTDALGDTLWTRTFGGASDELGFCVQETNDGGYVAAGSTLSFGAVNFDAYLVKTDGDGVVTEIGGGHPGLVPERFALRQNYPNPFNPATTISYDLPERTRVTLRIVDALGREVATLVDGVQEPGFRTVEFDARTLPSGVYFYRIRAGDFVETRKLVLVR